MIDQSKHQKNDNTKHSIAISYNIILASWILSPTDKAVVSIMNHLTTEAPTHHHHPPRQQHPHHACCYEKSLGNLLAAM